MRKPKGEANILKSYKKAGKIIDKFKIQEKQKKINILNISLKDNYYNISYEVNV